MIEVRQTIEGHRSRVWRLRSTDECGPGGNFEWTTQWPRNIIRNATALDLLEIGKALHMADRTVRRSFRLGQRTRRLTVRIPVIDPVTWRRQSSLLEELAGFASADDWKLELTQSPKRPPKGAVPPASYRSVVALFSGGLDSLCGAAHLAQNDEAPLFVSHSPPGRSNNLRLIRGVWEEFRKEPFPEEQCVVFRLEIRERNAAGRRAMFQEHSRRTRPFFFLALACATAVDRGIPAVQMSENGALGLSLPIRADAYGAMCSRQAHEFLLRGFARLLGSVAPRTGGWRVFNPFAEMTKGEACLLLKGAGRLAKKAVSCEYVGRQAAFLRWWKERHPRAARQMGDGPQCGLCVPCLIRRAALFRASIPDPSHSYFFDARRVARSVSGERTYLGTTDEESPSVYRVGSEHVFFLRRFLEQCARSDEVEFSLQYMPELRFMLNPGCDISAKLRSCHRLIRKLKKEMTQFLDSR
jgi:hypothetical protein